MSDTHNTLMIDEIKQEIAEAKTDTEIKDLIKMYKLYLREMKNPSQKAIYTNYIIEIENQNTRKGLFEKRIMTERKRTSNEPPEQISALDQLKASHKVLIETEGVADSTLINLKTQGEKIRGVSSKVSEVQGLLPQARRHINNMSKWWRG